MAKLEEYKRKRDFSSTSEPKARISKSEKPIFVVQRHHATRLHYDFRLEHNGALKSWAVPKGPSMNPDDKRLAVETEDHPIEYAGFEGTIPEGNYGAGSVLIWDKGIYENISGKDERISIEKAYDKGHIKFMLHGKRLRGAFSLIRIRNDKRQWLLIKQNDEYASDRNILEPVEEPKTGKVWQPNRKPKMKKGFEFLQELVGSKNIVTVAKKGKKHGDGISNPEKVLFPDSGYTKKDLVEYYEKIAEFMLPHVEERPISMRRFPDGIKGEIFFQKDAPDYFPEWIKKARIKKSDGFTSYAVCNDKKTLAYLANQAVEPHIWLSRIDNLENPDKMIFDLDPQNTHLEDVCGGANLLKEILEGVGLQSFVMSTGSRGLHVVVPLDRKLDFKKVSSFARVIARHLEDYDPSRFTAEQRKGKRKGNVFVDTYRNASTQTSVAPYSARAIEGAPVAVPLEWSEIRRGFNPQKYNIKNVFSRLDKKGEIWHDIYKKRQSLKKIQEK